VRTDITPWARATMTPEDWPLIHAAEPKDATVHASVNHRSKAVYLTVVRRKTVTHEGHGRTVREAWDALRVVEPLPEIVSLLNG
jgi:hypothetical protein